MRHAVLKTGVIRCVGNGFYTTDKNLWDRVCKIGCGKIKTISKFGLLGEGKMVE